VLQGPGRPDPRAGSRHRRRRLSRRGAIIRSDQGVRRLTTGAGLWLAGAIGAATGLGWIAVIAAGFAIVIIVALRVVDRQIEKAVGGRRSD